MRMKPPPEPTIVPNAPTTTPSRTSRMAIVGEKFTRTCHGEDTDRAAGSARYSSPFYDCCKPRSYLCRDRCEIVSVDD